MFYQFFILLSLNYPVFGSLKAINSIATYNDYKSLDPSAKIVTCELLTGELDLSSVVSVRDLTLNQCGACLRVYRGSNEIFVQVIDKLEGDSKSQLDLSEGAFSKLGNISEGELSLSWEISDKEKCNGIYSGSDRRGFPKGKQELGAVSPNLGGSEQANISNLGQTQQTGNYQAPSTQQTNNYQDPSNHQTGNYQVLSPQQI